MKLYVTLLIGIFLPICAYSQTMNTELQNTQTIDQLRNKIDALERRIESLEDKIDSLQNQTVINLPNNSNTSCSSSDYVNLVKDHNIAFPIAENLCPQQCAKLLIQYQRNNHGAQVECSKW